MVKARTETTGDDEIIYGTLMDLQREQPLEDNYQINGKMYRIRGMKNFEVNNLIKWCAPYAENASLQLAKDEVFTIVYGLVTPSFGAHNEEDVLAATLMVEQWPKSITQPLAEKIRMLTWPQYGVEPEPIELPE